VKAFERVMVMEFKKLADRIGTLAIFPTWKSVNLGAGLVGRRKTIGVSRLKVCGINHTKSVSFFIFSTPKTGARFNKLDISGQEGSVEPALERKHESRLWAISSVLQK
jgi:hypothetical protein